MVIFFFYDIKEDRGYIRGLFKCCFDYVFYFYGGKEKKVIDRKKKIRIENKIKEIKGFL